MPRPVEVVEHLRVEERFAVAEAVLHRPPSASEMRQLPLLSVARPGPSTPTTTSLTIDTTLFSLATTAIATAPLGYLPIPRLLLVPGQK